MIYRLLKRVIGAGNYDREALLEKADVYYLFGRLSEEEYRELSHLLGGE